MTIPKSDAPNIDARPVIGVTLGDPAGIGPEVVAKAVMDPRVMSVAHVVAIGPHRSLTSISEALGLRTVLIAGDELSGFPEGTLPVIDVPGNLDGLAIGRVSAEAGRLALRALERAVDLALVGRIDAITTAPWNKKAIQLTGTPYSGHTEVLAHLTETDPASVTMMLSHGRLRVFHVSTHVPLKSVFEYVRRDRLDCVIRLADSALRELGIAQPRIAVAGLNPHAGEGGLFGSEDGDEIAPAVDRACKEGLDVTGPLPGDTVFWKAVEGEFDGVLAMYHDQGHIPVKLVGRGHGVNHTVGIPIIRTSVDHGTAFDIAGKGTAEPTSMVEAIRFAADLARRRAEGRGQTALVARG